MNVEEMRLYDAQADYETWSLAHEILALGPLLRARRPRQAHAGYA